MFIFLAMHDVLCYNNIKMKLKESTNLNKQVVRFKKKYKVGLCLSGGGTRGFSYIGAFKG